MKRIRRQFIASDAMKEAHPAIFDKGILAPKEDAALVESFLIKAQQKEDAECQDQ